MSYLLRQFQDQMMHHKTFLQKGLAVLWLQVGDFKI